MNYFSDLLRFMTTFLSPGFGCISYLGAGFIIKTYLAVVNGLMEGGAGVKTPYFLLINESKNMLIYL